MIAIIIPIAMIYAAWLIRCLMNAQEEKECDVDEETSMWVTVTGDLVEITTAKFKQAI